MHGYQESNLLGTANIIADMDAIDTDQLHETHANVAHTQTDPSKTPRQS